MTTMYRIWELSNETDRKWEATWECSDSKTELRESIRESIIAAEVDAKELGYWIDPVYEIREMTVPEIAKELCKHLRFAGRFYGTPETVEHHLNNGIKGKQAIMLFLGNCKDCPATDMWKRVVLKGE